MKFTSDENSNRDQTYARSYLKRNAGAPVQAQTTETQKENNSRGRLSNSDKKSQRSTPATQSDTIRPMTIPSPPLHLHLVRVAALFSCELIENKVSAVDVPFGNEIIVNLASDISHRGRISLAGVSLSEQPVTLELM